jgi:hypothetical protein
LQSGGDFLALKLFLNAKCSGLIHKLWTAQGWPIHGSVVDSTVADGQSSPEPGLAVAPGRGDLPRGGKNGEDDAGHPGNCSPDLGWRRGGGIPATELRLEMATARAW